MWYCIYFTLSAFYVVLAWVGARMDCSLGLRLVFEMLVAPQLIGSLLSLVLYHLSLRKDHDLWCVEDVEFLHRWWLFPLYHSGHSAFSARTQEGRVIYLVCPSGSYPKGWVNVFRITDRIWLRVIL